MYQGDPVRTQSRALQNVVNSCGETGTNPSNTSKSLTVRDLLPDTAYNFWIIAINQMGEMGAVLKDTVSTTTAGKITNTSFK